jgi:hypothetical protein
MKELIQKYKFQIAIVVVGFLWIELLNFLLQLDIQSIIYPDSGSYFESAQNIYIYHRGQNYRPIGLALLHGIPFVFGSSNAFIYWFAFYMNFVFWIATSLTINAILTSFVSSKNAFLISLISLFFVGSNIYLFHLLSETIYVFFIVFSIYLIQKYYQTKQFYFLSIALALIVFTMLIRPGSKWIAILFTLFFSKELLSNYKNKFILFFYAAWMLVIIQCAGLKYQFGNFTISYIDSVTYYSYIGAKAMALKENKEYKEVKKERGKYIYSFKIDGNRIKKVTSADLLQQLQDNKINLLKAYVLNLEENTTSGNLGLTDIVNIKNTNHFEKVRSMFFKISVWQNRLITLIGMILGILMFIKKIKNETVFALIALFVLYIISVSAISSEQGDRFHLVIYPFVLLLVAKFLKDKKLLS